MQFTAAQIAEMTQGRVEGNPDVVISTFAKIEEGHEGAISFLANPKYTHYLYTTKASAVLVSNTLQLDRPVETTLIRVADPYATVAQLLQLASQFMMPKPSGIEQPCYIAEGVEVPDDAYIGAFAYIAPGVTLGKGVRIYPGAYVGHNAVIGEGSTLYAGVKVCWNCHIGRNCIINAGAVIGSDGFGFAPVDGHYEKIPQLGNVVIADNVEIGANTTIDRATMGSTRIDEGTKLDNLIQVAHNCTIGSDTVIAAQTGIAGSTHVGSHCMIGGQVGFAGHISVGDYTEIGAQSGISGNVRGHTRLMGYPAVEGKQFARQTVMVKNLNSLYERVNQLETELARITQQD